MLVTVAKWWRGRWHIHWPNMQALSWSPQGAARRPCARDDPGLHRSRARLLTAGRHLLTRASTNFLVLTPECFGKMRKILMN